MKVQLWGVRGSIPSPGPTTVRYGGNTTCLYVEAGESRIILDAGTGIRELGLSLLAHQPLDLDLLISHTHWDHIHGFPFFVPAYLDSSTIRMHGPGHYEKSLKQIMDLQMDYSYFPISTKQLGADLSYEDHKEGVFHLGRNEDVEVRAKYMNHPVVCLAYRLTHEGKSFTFTGDTEPYYNFYDEDDDEYEETQHIVDEQNAKVVEFLQDCDLVVYDASYFPEEYESKRGWGHSTTHQAIDTCGAAGVRHLVLTHHEPTRTDDQLDERKPDILKHAADNFPDMQVTIAEEKAVFEL